ncbi:hypothetical protein SAMN02745216_00105 [Desulfatibacillum alkenivorans DSM 16219]|jgi:hypothetical protein|uniref:Uncharacterized protein n=1 Tax=Desulfatibacillum alkenivorans DSM 16219 TaxID=1121393 RepID=A0A1M6BYT5_9BACT|nr:hypothetical protein [Desulfatibacillum alkenivorans]SHI53877.1 hypothetical protein SAMN02745216_00105 [Desulfatibacillum alkenivorans DSM 16219]
MPERKNLIFFISLGVLLLSLLLTQGCSTSGRVAVETEPQAAGGVSMSASLAPTPAAKAFKQPVFKGDLGGVISNYTGKFLQDSGALVAPPQKDEADDVSKTKDFSEKININLLIIGQATSSSHDVRGSDMVTVQEGTGQYKTEKSLFGEETTVEIKRSVMKPVPFIVRQASLKVDYKIVDLKTDTVLQQDSIQEDLEEKFGGDLEYKEFAGRKLCQAPSKQDSLEFLAKKISQKIAIRALALD